MIFDWFRNKELFYEEILRKLQEKTIKKTRGFEISIPSLRHLIKLKRIAGRPEDLRDIEMLEKIHGKID